MRDRIIDIAEKASLALASVCSYKSRLIRGSLDILVESSLSAMDTTVPLVHQWLEGLESRAHNVGSLRQTYREKRRPSDLLRPSEMRRAAYGIGISLLCLGLDLEIGTLSLVNSTVGLQLAASRIAVNIERREAENDKRRRRSLRAVLSDRSSPIFLFQLLTWISTPSRDIEYVLGDFLEGYENHSRKHGQDSAYQWAKAQTLREIDYRIKGLLGIISGIRMALHWLSHHRAGR